MKTVSDFENRERVYGRERERERDRERERERERSSDDKLLRDFHRLTS